MATEQQQNISFEQLISKILSPVVLVRTTPQVEQSCMKNNLSFIDMLRPYESIQKELYTRTIKEYESYSLKNFQIRFKTMDELSLEYGKDGDNVVIQQNEVQSKIRRQEQFLQSIVSEAYDPKRDDPLLTPALDREDRLSGQIKQGVNFTPWFDRYKEEFLSGFYTSDHETWEHPIACITAVSSTDPDPVRTHRELFNAEKPPKLFTDRFVDPDLCRFYVLVHDVQTGPDTQAKLHLRKMIEAFGTSCCRLLHINSSNGDAIVNDIWTPNLPRRDLFNKKISNMSRNNIGRYLSLQDVSYVASLIDELVTNGIIPHMERKIKGINLTVASKKRGISGAFSGWFRRKKDDVPTSGSRYTYVSAEIQLRKMADYCFMLRDYETALSTYRIASSEFKNNKQDMKHYAGAMEFSAICTLFVNQALITGVTSQVRKEVEQNLEVAVSNYLLIGETKFALRSALLSAISCKSRGDHKRAADTFTRSASIEPTNHLLNALIFEQTAYSYLLSQVPKNQIRKFALFLVLAGHKYFTLDKAAKPAIQQQLLNNPCPFDYSNFQVAHHAYRCYKLVLQVHYNREWSTIFEHMSGVMGDLSLEMTNSATDKREHVRFMRDSIQYFHDFVGGCNTSGKSSATQGPDDQKKNMKKFLDIVVNYMSLQPDHNKSPLDSALQLPEINTQNFKLLMNQYGNTPNYVGEYPRGEWRAMEEVFVKSIRSFHILPWERNNSSYKEPTVLFEPIFVEISVKNVLYIPVRISKLKLIASFVHANRDKDDNDDEQSETDGYKVIPEEIVMKPGQIQTIRLSIIPLAEGELKIQGVSWSLEDVIEGMKRFETRGRRLNENALHRSTVMYEPDNRLNLRVIGNMPLLSVDIENPPSELYQGQIHKSTLVIRNVGGMGLKNLKLKLSHPQFIAFGTQNKDNDLSIGGSVPAQEFTTSELNQPKFEGSDLSVVDLTQYMENVLAPNESISIPLYFRGTCCGSFNTKFLFYYEPEIANDIMKFRLHKLQSCLQVNESLRLDHFSQPSSVQVRDEEEFIFGITATNQQLIRTSSSNGANGITSNVEDATIHIHQISAISPEWRITPLNFVPGSVSPNIASLLATESTTFYFKICRIDKHELSQSTSSAVDESKNYLYHGHLSTQQQDQIRDTSSFPHLDLLYRDCVSMPDPLELESANPTLPNYSQTVYPFTKKHGLAVVVFWSSGKEGRIVGQSHILNSRFLPEKNTPIHMHPASNNPASRGPNALCPITVSLHYNDVLRHKFVQSLSADEANILSVPIVFQLSNISPDLVCDLTLELLSPDQQGGSNELVLHLPNSNNPPVPSDHLDNAPFLWMGSTRLRFKDVKPSQQLRVPVQACFFGPGKYNLNQFRICWTAEEIKENAESNQPDIIMLPKKPIIMTFNTMQYLMSIDDQSEEAK